MADKAKYYLDKKSAEFVIENYHQAKPFASFFPGIAGLYGIPLWVFYVNRGQCIASFGIKDKAHSILEFLPANQAWNLAASCGFRTFLKVNTGKQIVYYEPFQDTLDNLSFAPLRRMRIKPYELTLAEENSSLGIKTEVNYFTLPNEPIAALIRSVNLTNTGKKSVAIEMVDGLPKIVPYGTSNFFLKEMSRTIEAWMHVAFLKENIPFYNLNVDPSDRPETVFIEGGNFYLPFIKGKKAKILKTIVDPAYLFGQGDFSYPRGFLAKEKFNPALSGQAKESKTPCAFSYCDFTLPPKTSRDIFSVIGYAANKEKLMAAIDKITSVNFIEDKRRQNRALIGAIEDDIFTKSGSAAFDLYARQTYLDNVLRGGYPVSFKTQDNKSVFYAYARKHGDLERDYNNFVLNPTYFSQGNGNYRDINQNRRSDNWFNSDVGESNLVNFLNLIQLDGFNPLMVKGVNFVLDKSQWCQLRLDLSRDSDVEKLNKFFLKAYSPGELLMFIEDNGIILKAQKEEFLKKALSLSRKIEDAEYGEGFWTDHWAYNLDLMENYLSVYPEKLKEILSEKKVFTFFDNAEVVRPRSEKYVLAAPGKIRQHHALKKDAEKEKVIASRQSDPQRVRSDFGKGAVVYVNLLNKLLCLLANKLSSLDAAGTGIEMEANKPNWFDSLNGLPSLFGSSVNETFELKRLVIFIQEALRLSGAYQNSDVALLSEICDFLKNLDKLLQEYFSPSSQQDKDNDFIFWNKAYSLKEEYRGLTRLGVSGKEKGIGLAELYAILDRAKRKVEIGLERSRDKKTGLYHAYFINEVVDYEPSPDGIKARKFRQLPLPLFLESQVHALRLEKDEHKAANLYKAIRKSALYDKGLKMYKSCVNLGCAPIEIGRCRVFSPGWLEHETVWLHMEYKFLLELLRCGLHGEFYDDFFSCLIPFLDARKYGRSILENSSFIVSSAFSDKNLRGNGFVARLSGSTAEFISIWRIMNTGFNPFKQDKQGNLTLEFRPILHKKLFAKNKTYSFKFLGKALVTYHSSRLSNTFGKSAVSPRLYIFKDENNELITIKSQSIPHPYAEKIRSGLIKKIDVYLA